MPQLKLTRKLLEITPGLPVIVCTGFSEGLDEVKAKALGIREYLIKPITKTVLAKAIRKVLS